MVLERLFVAVTVLGTSTASLAQDYFEFDEIPGVSDVPAVQVDLTPMWLGIASQTIRAENPAVADLLASIDGVRVRVYTVLEDPGALAAYVDDTSGRLSRDNWEQIISVQDEEKVKVFIRSDQDSITGATAMIVADQEAVFINVAGSISSQQLAGSMAALGSGDLFASLSGLGLPSGSAAMPPAVPSEDQQ
jgi:hypothetical protein